jgi:hypothetical protein
LVHEAEYSFSEDELFCHKFAAAPVGVFYTSDNCIRFNSDGTGTIDWAGGTSGFSGFVDDDYQRSDSLEDFRWGALVESSGLYVRQTTYENSLQLMLQGADGDPVSPQVPLYYWNDTTGQFVNPYPDILSQFPADAQSGACMFDPPRCINDDSVEKCWANGVLHGPYKRYDYDGNLVEEGEYTNGVKTGPWTTHGWSSGQEGSRTECTYVDGDENHYYKREYKLDPAAGAGAFALVEEGMIVDGYQEGEWTFYFQPDSPTSSSPIRAVGLVREKGSFSQGQKVGEWIENYIEYDQPFPTTYGEALTAYYASRQAVGVCARRKTNMDDGSATSYLYGDPGCADSTCNGGLSMIIYTSPGSTAVCTTASGGPTDCVTTSCR